MNETSNKEISLKWLLYRALRAWKLVLVCSVAIGLLLGVGSAVINGSKLANEAFMNTAEDDFNQKHDEWKSTRQEILNRIETLEDSREQQLEYNENSVLMEIDPFQKNVASVELYVEYDYQIIPDFSYQPIDLSGRILKSYSNYMTHGGMYQYVIENLKTKQGYEIERRYLEELINISTDTTNRMISVSVTHPDKEMCKNILTYVKDSVSTFKPSVVSEIDVHEIKFINETIDETIDPELVKVQRDNEQYIIEADTKLAAANKELRELQDEPVFKYTVGEVVKDAITLAVIGMVAAIVVLIASIMIITMLSGKLLAPETIKERFGVRVMGLLPVSDEKKAFSGFSANIARFGGVKVKHGEYDVLAKTIGAGIKSEMISVVDGENGKTIAFTGNVAAEEIEKAVAAMLIDGYNTVCAPNILTDPESIDKVVSSDYVVLVETQEKTAIVDIEKEIETLKAWNKPVLGAVIVNADTIL